jgi:hypothetical protein
MELHRVAGVLLLILLSFMAFNYAQSQALLFVEMVVAVLGIYLCFSYGWFKWRTHSSGKHDSSGSDVYLSDGGSGHGSHAHGHSSYDGGHGGDGGGHGGDGGGGH